MKNTRTIAKEATRALILKKAKELILSKGIFNTSTKQISNRCNILEGAIQGIG